ncbi:MAG: LytTR family DNA-binding domain-containing protein [Bacteroidota bacterium]
MPTAVIIEDNPAAEEHLRVGLRAHCPTIELLASADTVVQGAKLIRQLKPDILFLDIELPDGTGFDVLDIIGDWSGSTIFITGLNDQAIRAFRYAAVDYLLKPLDHSLLKAAVDRATRQLGQQSEQRQLLQQIAQKSDDLPSRLALYAQDRIQLVDIEQIIRLEAESNYTTFYLNTGKKIVVGKTLKHFDQLLLSHHFLRVHQSHLINPSYIREFVRTDGGYLLLKEGTKVPVSVRRRQLVMDYLQKLS